MALSDYALVTVADLKGVLTVTGSGKDGVLEDVINRASSAIEAYLGRELVARAAANEYHTVEDFRPELDLAEAPLITITSVSEGAHGAGSWQAQATLVAGQDYVADTATGRLTRLSSGARTGWARGFESVRVVYQAGYATRDAVPAAIRDVCLGVAARKYSQIVRGGDFSAQSQTDGLGSVSRFLPGEILRMEREALAPFVRWHYGTRPRRA